MRNSNIFVYLPKSTVPVKIWHKVEDFVEHIWFEFKVFILIELLTILI